MQSDLKERHKAIRERILDLSAQGLTRRDAADRAGVTVRAVSYALSKARAENDPRADRREPGTIPGAVHGVPFDLVKEFQAAAAARKISARELRRRILSVVTRDNLFDALDLDAAPQKGPRQ